MMAMVQLALGGNKKKVSSLTSSLVHIFLLFSNANCDFQLDQIVQQKM